MPAWGVAVALALAGAALADELKMLSGPYAPDLQKVADGDYRGVCPGYLDLDLVRVTATVKDRKITNVAVRSKDDRPLASLQVIPKAVVDKQNIMDVNAVTGATITSHAVLCATAAALKAAEKPAP